MKGTKVLLALLLFFGALDGSGARADAPADNQGLDALLGKRLECLRNRVSSGSASLTPSDRCFHLTADQASYVTARRDEFCSDPAHFCSTITDTGAGAAERDSKLVSPRCETMSGPDIGSALFGPNGASRLSGDSTLIGVMRQQWGCDSGKLTAFNGRDDHPRLFLDFSCDSSKMPFPCAAPQAAGLGPAPVAGSPEALARRTQDALLASGASLVPRGSTCIIRANEPDNGVSGVGLPGPFADESGDHYLSRLSPDMKAIADARVAGLRARTQKVFGAPAELLGAGSANFNIGARIALTPDRLDLAARSFAAAKAGVIAYLRDTLHAPQAVLDRVSATDLADLSVFSHNPPSADDQLKMTRFEQVCHDSGSTAFGHSYAQNLARPAPGQGSEVLICPSMLLDSDLTNPRSLVEVLARQLGHSVDPCRLGKLTTQVTGPSDSGDCATPSSVPKDQERDVASFLDRIGGRNGFVACIEKPLGRGTVPPVRPGHPDWVANYASELQKCKLLSKADSCSWQQYGPKGANRFCPVDFSSDPEPQNCKKAAQQLVILHDISPRPEQANEAFADQVAAGALVPALDLYSFPASAPYRAKLSDLTPEDRAAEILTTVSQFCFAPVVSGEAGGFPGTPARASIYSSTGSIRAALQCRPPVVAAASAAQPVGACEKALAPPAARGKK